MIDVVLVAGPWLLGVGATASQIRPEVEEIVTDIAAPVFLHVGIEGVERPGIIVVEPRTKGDAGSQSKDLLFGIKCDFPVSQRLVESRISEGKPKPMSR